MTMPAYAGAHVIRNISIEIEGTEYGNQVTKARLVPDVPVQVLRTCVPDGAVTDRDSATWVFELSGVQDMKTGGLAKALYDAYIADTDLDIVYIPKAGTGQDQATFTVKASPVEFGGEQGNFRTFEVELAVVGQPVFGISV